MALLVLQTAWLAWSATWQSPTLNEPGHLASGLAHWTLGRFEPYAVNPPVVRMVAALPVLAAGFEADWSSFRGRPGERAEFLLGSAFIDANGPRSQRLFVWARWACIPFSLLGAWMCFVWGRALFGDAAGLLACGLWCVEPNLIAHGQLITPDVAAAAFGLVALWTFWRWLVQPGWGRALLAGAALGLAILTKFSWLLLVGLWPIIALGALVFSPSGAPAARNGRSILQLAAMLAAALYVINAAYAFSGSFSRLDSFQFVSERLSGMTGPGQLGNRFADCWSGRLPVPAPRPFLAGLDLQQRDFEQFPHESYLWGEWRRGGWRHYYLAAALVKLPVGLWLVAMTAIAVAWFRWRRPAGQGGAGAFPPHDSRERRLAIAVLVLPTAALFAVVSSQLAFNHHFRYVLPCAGPALVLMSSVLSGAGSWLRAWVLTNAAWVAASSAIAAPFSLAYFNELAGGMHEGSRHLLHSNIDWGQDLVALQQWISDHPDSRPVYLAYYGFYDPQAYGVRAEAAPQGPFWGERPRDWSFRPGWYAISVNYLRGTAWRLHNRQAYVPLLAETPVAWCGGSIAIYEVDEALAQTLTAAVVNAP